MLEAALTLAVHVKAQAYSDTLVIRGPFKGEH